jgi:hypothetical protein
MAFLSKLILLIIFSFLAPSVSAAGYSDVRTHVLNISGTTAVNLPQRGVPLWEEIILVLMLATSDFGMEDAFIR